MYSRTSRDIFSTVSVGGESPRPNSRSSSLGSATASANSASRLRRRRRSDSPVCSREADSSSRPTATARSTSGIPVTPWVRASTATTAATPGSLRRTAAHIRENAVLPEPQAPSTAHTTGVAVARTRSQNSSTCSRRPSVSLLNGSPGSATNSPARAFIGSSGGDSSSRLRALTSLYARTRGELRTTPRTNPTNATNPTSITFPGCEVSHGCAGPSHGKATAANMAPTPP